MVSLDGKMETCFQSVHLGFRTFSSSHRSLDIQTDICLNTFVKHLHHFLASGREQEMKPLGQPARPWARPWTLGT